MKSVEVMRRCHWYLRGGPFSSYLPRNETLTLLPTDAALFYFFSIRELFFFYIYFLFIYLTVPGLTCNT